MALCSGGSSESLFEAIVFPIFSLHCLQIAERNCMKRISFNLGKNVSLDAVTSV